MATKYDFVTKKAKIVFGTIFDFLLLLVCSLIIGAVMGFGLSYLLKVNDSLVRSPIKETSLILLTGYATYLLGEICGFSGIITLFTCSIIMGRYAFMNISMESQRGTGLAFETVAYVAEAFVYAYLGASIFSISGKWSAFGFSLLLIPIFPIVRGVMVYLLPCIYKLSKKEFPLKSK